MYGLLREGLAGISLRRPQGRRGIPSTVLLLGLTSMFTDVSSEMVTAILPLYMLFSQQASIVQFGLVDGLYQGASAVFRIITGFLADRQGRAKEIATAGYGLSMLTRIGMIAGPTAPVLAGLIAVDRFGKGIRTAPRDALISMSSDDDALGASFGLHRALDTIGAMLGPVIAFAILWVAPRRFDAVFVASLSFAVIGVAFIGIFVRNPEQHTRPAIVESVQVSVRTLLRVPRFPLILGMSSLLSFFTVSDAFVYLLLQRTTGLGLTFFPLLFVGTSTVYFLLAFPLGGLADRVGRMQTFLVGQVLLLGVYAVLFTVHVSGLVTMVAALTLFGLFYACTDGVLAAATSEVIPAAVRTSGLSLVGTSTAIAKLGSSVVFGLLWSWQGPTFALTWFAVGLVISTLGAVLAFRRARGIDAATA